MGSRVRVVAVLGVALVVALGVPRPALANSGGRTGSSGKGGGTCSGCHQGGTAPRVSLEGPTALEAGVPALYTFRVETAAAITGMNAAATDGVTLLGDPDGGATRGEDGELVHARTLSPVDGGAVYTFTVTAPYGETISLWAAGNACDDDGQTDGDESAATRLDVAVSGPPRPPPPPSAPPPGAPPPAGAAPDASPDGSGAGVPASEGGCALASPGGGAGLPALGLLVLGTRLARSAARRRRRGP